MTRTRSSSRVPTFKCITRMMQFATGPFFTIFLSESFRKSSGDGCSSGAMTELALTSKQPGKY